MIDALQELEALLRKYGLAYLANTVAVAMGYAVARDERLWPGLCSDEWWSDSDSIAAVEPAVPGGFARDARADSRRLRELMPAICAEMQTHCIPPPQARLMANPFNKWLVSQVQTTRIRHKR